MKNLIVNADDLGWTAGVNRGIAEAHRHGIVTSASLLANGSAFASGVEVARSTPGLGVGVHLNLSDGAPVAARELVTSLVNDAGEFEGGPENLLLRIASRGLALHEVEQEWEAQIEKVRDAGIQPTHVDGHKHVHMLPGLFEIALRLAKRYAIAAIRVAHEASSLRAALSTGERTAHRGGVETRSAGARIEIAGARCSRASGTRRNLHGRLFLRHRANRRDDQRWSRAIAAKPAGRHNRIDVPSGIRR